MYLKPFFITLFCSMITLGVSPHSLPADLSRASASPTELTIPQPMTGTESIYNYIVDILTLALEVTATEYGPVTLLAVDEAALQSDQLRDLELRQLDITWSVTSIQREKRHQAVYVPITNGLFGKRILMIRNDEARFEEIKSENTLKKMRLVQGHDWPDAHIFRANGYNVIESSYRGTFTMLSAGFVDAFPRGVLEIYQELAAREDKAFKVERYVMFDYPSALFFFVSKDRKMLANRLEEGLKKLYESGELQNHLTNQPFYQSALQTMKGRMVYKLFNPLLSDEATQALERFKLSDE